MLGGMALKWRWKARRKALGLPTDKPNIVMGANVQVVWEKFALLGGRAALCPARSGTAASTAEEAVQILRREHDRGRRDLGLHVRQVVQAVAEIAKALDDLHEAKGWDIPGPRRRRLWWLRGTIHRRRSGWTSIPRVRPAIRSSKDWYGLVYPGVGWVMWREPADLPEDLVFNVNYLGGNMPTFALNFSRPGSQIVAQYYNFIRLGFMGYKAIQQQCRTIAKFLASKIAGWDPSSCSPTAASCRCSSSRSRIR